MLQVNLLTFLTSQKPSTLGWLFMLLIIAPHSVVIFRGLVWLCSGPSRRPPGPKISTLITETPGRLYIKGGGRVLLGGRDISSETEREKRDMER